VEFRKPTAGAGRYFDGNKGAATLLGALVKSLAGEMGSRPPAVS